MIELQHRPETQLADVIARALAGARLTPDDGYRLIGADAAGDRKSVV